MQKAWMGIDTSAYTTSVALLLEDGKTIYRKKLLEVKKGERGLRQSEAVFLHLKNLPELIDSISEEYDLKNILAVAVSSRPRPREDSYMPVFEAGRSFAKVLGSTLKIPVYETSHQENHIEAVLRGSGADTKNFSNPFLAVHFSGGTSEILKVTPKEEGYAIDLAAGSKDLKAGQLIDRIGVKLGLAFPAGKELERLAYKAKDNNLIVPSRLEGVDFHFSGQENFINSLLEKGTPPEEAASALFRMIAKTLERSIRKIGEEDKEVEAVLLGGGVMSSTFIKDILKEKLTPAGFKLISAPAQYSGDNALGNAFLARRIYEKGEKCQQES